MRRIALWAMARLWACGAFPCPKQPNCTAQAQLVICAQTIDIPYVRLAAGFVYADEYGWPRPGPG